MDHPIYYRDDYNNHFRSIFSITKMKNLDSLVLRFFIFTWFIFWAYVFFQIFYPSKPYEQLHEPFQVIKTNIADVDFIIDYCKYVKSVADITFYFEIEPTKTQRAAGMDYILTKASTFIGENMPLGCNKTTYKLLITDYIRELADGRRIRLKQTVYSHINQFRIFSGEYYSTWFRIL